MLKDYSYKLHQPLLWKKSGKRKEGSEYKNTASHPKTILLFEIHLSLTWHMVWYVIVYCMLYITMRLYLPALFMLLYNLNWNLTRYLCFLQIYYYVFKGKQAYNTKTTYVQWLFYDNKQRTYSNKWPIETSEGSLSSSTLPTIELLLFFKNWLYHFAESFGCLFNSGSSLST